MLYVWIPFLLVLAFVFFRMVRPESNEGLHSASHAQSNATARRGGPHPLDVARRRLASGEITKAQFEEILQRLG